MGVPISIQGRAEERLDAARRRCDALAARLELLAPGSGSAGADGISTPGASTPGSGSPSLQSPQKQQAGWRVRNQWRLRACYR